MNCFPQPDAGVLTSAIPNEDILLVHQDTGKYYSLNQTGSLIWKRIEGSACDADIVEELVSRFDVTPEAAAAALSEFLHDLTTQRLITISREKTA